MKNKIILIALLLFTISTVFAQQENKSITVNISGIKGNKGNIFIAVYTNKDNFLKKPYLKKIGNIKNKKSTIVFKNVKPGTYAISLYYDANSNKKLDFNAFGIPKEQTGASNNAKGNWGPPKFKDAKFKIVNEDIIQNIKL